MSITMPCPQSTGMDVSGNNEFSSGFLECTTDECNEARILIYKDLKICKDERLADGA